MRYLILFLLLGIINAKSLFDRACKENPQDCVAADFAFSKEYLGQGVCGGMALQKRKDPAGNDVDILQDCGYWDTCQFPEALEFDCSEVLFQTNKDACYEYIGTGTCRYSPDKGLIVSLGIAAVILLVWLGCIAPGRAQDAKELSQLRKRHDLLVKHQTIEQARIFNAAVAEGLNKNHEVRSRVMRF